MKPLSKNSNPDGVNLPNSKPDLYDCKSNGKALLTITLNVLLRLLQKILFQ